MKKKNWLLFNICVFPILLAGCQGSEPAASDENIAQDFAAIENKRIDNGDLSQLQVRTNPSILIVGGERAEKGQFPWQIHLTMSNRRGSWSCGGVIIDDSNILTAAHCGFDSAGDPFKARQLTVRYDGIKPRRMKKAKVEKIIIEPDYNVNRTGYDIAILNLKKPIPLSAGRVEAVSLPLQNAAELSEGESLQVSGFGANYVGGLPLSVGCARPKVSRCFMRPIKR